MSVDIEYNAATKQITTHSSDKDLQEDVSQLNTLVSNLTSITTEIPESPEPSKALSPLIRKLITSALDRLKNGKYPEAIKDLTVAIDASNKRARWEAFVVQLQELNQLLQIRCDAYLMNKQYLESYGDADLLLSTGTNLAENFLRKSRALLHLGRLYQSKVELERGLCFHEGHQGLLENLKLVQRAIDIENGDI